MATAVAEEQGARFISPDEDRKARKSEEAYDRTHLKRLLRKGSVEDAALQIRRMGALRLIRQDGNIDRRLVLSYVTHPTPEMDRMFSELLDDLAGSVVGA